MKRVTVPLLVVASLAACLSPAYAWVAVYGRPAVYVRGGCCYGPAVVIRPAPVVYVAPAPVYVAPAPVYVAPAPVYVPAPAPVYSPPPPSYYYPPAVGSIVTALPPGSVSVNINGVSYLSYGGAYYQPFYSSGALVYLVVSP